MSGLGGGGAMVLYRAREDRYEVIDYGMRAPACLRPEDYPLTGDGVASILPLARVKDDRNFMVRLDRGARRGRRHGGSPPALATMPWRELLVPSGESPAESFWFTGGPR